MIAHHCAKRSTCARNARREQLGRQRDRFELHTLVRQWHLVRLRRAEAHADLLAERADHRDPGMSLKAVADAALEAAVAQENRRPDCAGCHDHRAPRRDPKALERAARAIEHATDHHARACPVERDALRAQAGVQPRAAALRFRHERDVHALARALGATLQAARAAFAALGVASHRPAWQLQRIGAALHQRSVVAADIVADLGDLELSLELAIDAVEGVRLEQPRQLIAAGELGPNVVG
jgi:hypothetical protein